jgi:hypothetical protein
MDKTRINSGNLLRLIGIMAIGVGLAWALQTVGFGGEGSAFVKLMWVVAAASVCGAGFGLIVASGALREGDSERASA